jgi:peptidoglycan/xylan/chitin deacetylase (PgdA/CDA1 family)
MPIRLAFTHTISRLLHWYADWRIGATAAEKLCYKQSNSILLTFDDYGTPEQITTLLTILADKNTKAMFFVTGQWAQQHPEIIARIQQAGHALGNHTATHLVLKGKPDELVRREIAGGLAARPWFRPPQGRYNNRVRSIAAELGYVLCYWTIDSRDWTGASPETMRHTIMSELRPGAVILFHIHGAHTAELLPSLIDAIRARGYQLTSFAETWQP